jgi:hypothetical protein
MTAPLFLKRGWGRFYYNAIKIPLYIRGTSFSLHPKPLQPSAFSLIPFSLHPSA